MSEKYNINDPSLDEDPQVYEGPQSKLEKRYIDEYLESRGVRWEDLARLPEEEAKALMIEASRYATAKLAKQEARAQFRSKIRGD
ncbi:MAG: hypothetical protein M5U05_14485 [Anaerolineales bacterium]|nr:hypothetical protein [Anaerolineales bacterium]